MVALEPEDCGAASIPEAAGEVGRSQRERPGLTAARTQWQRAAVEPPR